MQILLLLQKLNERVIKSTREEYITYFDTSPTMMPKSDGP